MIDEEELAANAARKGAYLKQVLSAIPGILEVRGRGLLLGLEFEAGRTAKDSQKALFNQGILTGTSHDPQVLRLMPPLILDQVEADIFVEALKRT